MIIELFQGDDAELTFEFLNPLTKEPLPMTGHTVECLVSDPSGNPVEVDAMVTLDASQGLFLQPLKLLSAGQYSIQPVNTDSDGKVKHEPILNVQIKKVLPRVPNH